MRVPHQTCRLVILALGRLTPGYGNELGLKMVTQGKRKGVWLYPFSSHRASVQSSPNFTTGLYLSRRAGRQHPFAPFQTPIVVISCTRAAASILGYHFCGRKGFWAGMGMRGWPDLKRALAVSLGRYLQIREYVISIGKTCNHFNSCATFTS
jgi:hypothetical protein